MRRLLAAILFSLGASSAHAAGPLPGNLLLLSECPGDAPTPEKPKTPDSARESLLASMLTPVLTGAISQGIKAYGAHLQAAATEAEVDSIHTGSHFFAATKNGVRDNVRCLVVATRAKRDSSATLEAVTAGYQSAYFEADPNGAQKLTLRGAGSAALAEKLRLLGYGDRMPAFLAVIDVENNVKSRTGRFVPRYVFLDHSLREKGSKKARDIKLGITMTSPEADKPIAADMLQFAEISPGQWRARTLESSTIPKTLEGRESLLMSVETQQGQESRKLLVTGNWFILPSGFKAVSDRTAALKSLGDTAKQETLAARQYGAGATELGETLIPDKCPSILDGEERLVLFAGKLAAENAKKEAARNPTLVGRYTQAGKYFESCLKVKAAEEGLKKAMFADGERFLPVDVVVTEREYRHRPVAKFVGQLLGNDKVSEGLTTALVNEYDPATRRSIEETEAKADATALDAYENALLSAHKAGLDYTAAADDKRAAALLDMEFKQRAANRLAARMDIPLPFPGAGIRP